MFRSAMMLVAVLMIASPAALAAVIPTCWYEAFDAYNPGTGLHGQGGWEGWGGDPAGDAYVTAAQGMYGSQSVEIVGASDLVRTYCGCVFGRWTFTAWQYLPADFSGQTYFILLNTYGGANNWSTQLRFDSGLGVVESEYETAQLPLVTGEWIELRIAIDLDANTQEIYYDDALLTTKSWSEGVSGSGAVEIAAVDLYANASTPVYYDNLSLCFYCPGDFDGDMDRDLADLARLLSNYGTTEGACYTDGDTNLDGAVDLVDLAGILSGYGLMCE